MIEVELLDPFLLPKRVRVEEVLRESLAGSALEVALSAPSAVFYSDHRSAEGMRLEPSAARSQIAVTVPAECDPEVTVPVDARSVGVVRARCRVRELADLRRVEEELPAELNAPLPQWCQGFLAGLPAGHQGEPPGEARPGARLLWWPRILSGVPASKEPAASRVYGEQAVLTDGAHACVGDGYTTVHGDVRPGEVFDGLESATVDWVVIDEVNRELAGALLGLTGQEHELPPYDRALELERGSACCCCCGTSSPDTCPAARDECCRRIIWALTIVVGLQGVLRRLRLRPRQPGPGGQPGAALAGDRVPGDRGGPRPGRAAGQHDPAGPPLASAATRQVIHLVAASSVRQH